MTGFIFVDASSAPKIYSFPDNLGPILPACRTHLILAMEIGGTRAPSARLSFG
jgi:hypothetical protein